LTGKLTSFRRNRYLDPANGRFTQPDPIGLAGGLNSYGFAGGDPVNFADPFGLCPGIPGTDFFTLSDCPAGYFKGLGAVAGGITGSLLGRGVGGVSGGATGELACAGFPACGAVGVAAGQRVGGRLGMRAGAISGARLGDLVDGALAMARAGKGRGGETGIQMLMRTKRHEMLVSIVRVNELYTTRSRGRSLQL
jgi:hypothetical protein